jgi:hypothetical protein
VAEDRNRDRWLARGLGYVSSPLASLDPTASAVDPEFQRQISAQARRRDEARRKEAWLAVRGEINGAVDAFAGTPDAQGLQRELGYVRRAVRGVDRRLGL